LANVYMRRFVFGWKTLGHERRLQARIVNDDADFVSCCRGTADEAMAAMQDMMSELKLTVNEAKARLRRVASSAQDSARWPTDCAPRLGSSIVPNSTSINPFAVPTTITEREAKTIAETWASRGITVSIQSLVPHTRTVPSPLPPPPETTTGRPSSSPTATE
jgi:hypothetical protein